MRADRGLGEPEVCGQVTDPVLAQRKVPEHGKPGRVTQTTKHASRWRQGGHVTDHSIGDCRFHRHLAMLPDRVSTTPVARLDAHSDWCRSLDLSHSVSEC